MSKIANNLGLCFILILFSSTDLFTQKSSTEVQPKKSPFFFDITYKNRSKKSKHLTKVGIAVRNFDESIVCMGIMYTSRYYTDFLQPMADYVIRFHLSNEETIILSDPPIGIKPDEAARFTISYFPSSIGTCTGRWSAEISGVLIFDDGEKVYTNSELLTGEDVEKYIERTPEETELLAALKHRNVDIRAQAFAQLPKSTLDKESIKFIIKRGLANEDARIRIATAISAYKMDFKPFAKEIASLLNSSLNSLEQGSKGKVAIPPSIMALDRGYRNYRSSAASEAIVYCRALGKLKDPDTVDVLISALINLNFDSFPEASDALIMINHPEVILKVRPLLLKNINWLGGNHILAQRYLQICKVIIAYRDMKGAEILLNLISKSDHSLLADGLVEQIYRSINGNEIIRDPFILAMHPAIEGVFKAPKSGNRYEALKLLCLMPFSDQIIQGYLKIGFKDSDTSIRGLSVTLAAELGYKALADEIILLLKSTDSKYERQRYCEALQTLKRPCN
jgi:hypothetical protein